MQIPLDFLASIEEIYQDGGNEIYMQICPLWDGEDDQFDIHSADDARLLPNLKFITLIYNGDRSFLEQFEKKAFKQSGCSQQQQHLLLGVRTEQRLSANIAFDQLLLWMPVPLHVISAVMLLLVLP